MHNYSFGRLNQTVTITNVTSYLGAHLCLMLLKNGHAVRGTVTHFEHNPVLDELYSKLTDVDQRNFKVFISDLKDTSSLQRVFTGSDIVIHIIDEY